jgi:hypothetical protein
MKPCWILHGRQLEPVTGGNYVLIVKVLLENDKGFGLERLLQNSV